VFWVVDLFIHFYFRGDFMEDKKNQDVEEPEIVDSLREKRQTQAKPPLTKTAGLEAVINISSALKKYEEEAAPSSGDFLLWR